MGQTVSGSQLCLEPALFHEDKLRDYGLQLSLPR